MIEVHEKAIAKLPEEQKANDARKAGEALEALRAKANEALQAQLVECKSEIEATLARYPGAALIGIPQWEPDGAGGWRITVRIEVIAASR
jgi:hypothetical protein